MSEPKKTVNTGWVLLVIVVLVLGAGLCLCGPLVIPPILGWG